MHQHGTAQAANRCSRLCGANQADREYYRKHGHYREAPTADCLACRELRERAEEKAQAERKWRC